MESCKIKQYFFYENMAAQVASVTQTCELCEQTKLSKRREPYGLRPVPAKLFSEISVDHKSLDNGYYVLVIMDILSRYPDVAFVRSTSFEANKEPLLKYFSYFQTPLILRSDNGASWNSEKFKEFARQQNFKHDLITPRSPIANSEVERVMQTISKAYERSKILKDGLWRESILNAIKAKRCTPHPALGQSPYEIVFGRKMRPGNIAVAPWINKPTQNPSQRLKTIEEKLYSSKKERQEKFSKQPNVRYHDFREGDQVWYLDKSKIKPKTYNSNIFQVIKVEGSRITAMDLTNGKIIVRHSTHFKRYKQPISPPELKLNTDTDKNDDQTLENDNYDSLLAYEPMPLQEQPRVGAANRLPNARQNDIPTLHERLERGGREIRNHAAPQNARDVRFEDPQGNNLRRGRSAGPAPHVPHVLPAAPERSAKKCIENFVKSAV